MMPPVYFLRGRLIFVASFLSAFAAGVCVGMLWRQPEKASQDGFLAPLNLSEDQREKIKAIWTDAMKTANWEAQRERRETARKERDSAVLSILSPEQKPKYEEITVAYQKKMDELSQDSKKARDEAYEKTKAILNETQRVAYDELRKKRNESHRPRGERGSGAEKNPPPAPKPEDSAPAK